MVGTTMTSPRLKSAMYKSPSPFMATALGALRAVALPAAPVNTAVGFDPVNPLIE